MDRLHNYDFIVFTSVNGVDFFFKKLFERKMDSRSLCKAKIAAIGPGTAKRLRDFGLIADIVPEKYIAEGVVSELQKYNIKGKNIFIPRAQEAREVLIDELKKSGANVVVVPVYKTVVGDVNTETIYEKIKNNKIDFITFTSSSTVNNFFLN